MKITFGRPYGKFKVTAPKGTLISFTKEPTELEDGIYIIGDDGYYLLDEDIDTDTIYISVEGEDHIVANGARVCYPADGIEVRAGSSVLPFKGSVKGGDGSGSEYTYHKYGNIVVRVYHEGRDDQQILWFFRGWNQSSTTMQIPYALQPYAPGITNNAVASANYIDNTGATQSGWIGFYNNTIRAWSQDYSENVTGVMYGVVDPYGAEEQTNPYTDNPYIDGGGGGGGFDPSVLGTLAYKDSADGEYTPTGTITGTMPSLTYSAETEELTFDAGSLPTFTGTAATITVR